MKYRHADRRTYHYIYKITRTDGSGKYYIGMHSTDNLEDGYFGSGRVLWHSIKKHGKQAHQKQVLEFLPSRALLKERERELVSIELLNDPLCMNIAVGGNANATNEQRVKWGLEKQKRPEKSQERREQLRLERLARGLRHTDETKALMSSKGRGIKKSKEAIAKSVATKAARMSDETRAKLNVNGGKHWYNDGERSFLLLEQEAHGLRRGRLKS